MYHQPGQQPDEIEILNVPVHKVTMEQTIDLARQFMDQPGCTQIATVNPEFVMTAQEDAQFTAVLREADLCIPDGIGLVELFWGPTLAFKDVALQFLGNLFEYLLAESGEHMNILGATSGDTGSAAQALFRIIIESADGRSYEAPLTSLGFKPDGEWHRCTIDLSKVEQRGVDLTKIKVLLAIAWEGGVNNGDYFKLDDVYLE